MKPTKRLSFNFQRSYFDVMNKLENESDRLSFLEAVINKSFLDEDPKDLSMFSDLAYESQRHFIEKSVKGYKDRMKTDLLGNTLSHTLTEGVSKALSHTLPNKSKSKNKSNNNITIEARKTKFKKLLSPFQDKYSIELLKDFYQYWTEHGENDKKVRFEKEKSFSVERRLSTWKKKEAQFNNKPKGRDLGNGFGTYIKSS